jgi:hypothetical protein
MTRQPSAPRRSLAWLAVVLLASGCGIGYGDVSGTVKYNGAPVAGGTITFYDSTGQPVSGEIKSDGTYAVKHVATGLARITVVAPLNIEFPGMGGAKTGEPKPQPLPPKYGDPEQSGLTLDVHTGSQTKDIPLD